MGLDLSVVVLALALAAALRPWRARERETAPPWPGIVAVPAPPVPWRADRRHLPGAAAR